MLASNTPFWVLDQPAEFWHLRVSKEYPTKPAFYLGQTVLHRIKRGNGEILHPVYIDGLHWDGQNSWHYFIMLPDDHPLYEDGEECEWVEEHLLEQM